MSSNLYFSDAALRWLETILFERFGQRFKLVQRDDCLELCFPEAPGKIIFSPLIAEFHGIGGYLPCASWFPEEEGFESVIGKKLPMPGARRLDLPLVDGDGSDDVLFRYDVPGLVYWMLTRREELGPVEVDKYGRFLASSSHAWKHGYLGRPIVDEWLCILQQVLQRKWPGMHIESREFSIDVSHDVDRPSIIGPNRYSLFTLAKSMRTLAVDILVRRDPEALAGPVRLNPHILDPADRFNTFDWLMDRSEEQGLISTFYFIAGMTDFHKDSGYNVAHPAIRDLIRRIHARGHRIGLHPSFNTFQKGDLIQEEFARLVQVMEEVGVQQSEIGARMHYLRWEHPATMRALNEAGIAYDNTLTYADSPGFRCGTCHEYPAFDPVSQTVLNIRIRPLVVMEVAAIDFHGREQNDWSETLARIIELKSVCEKVNGTFSLLWHNSELLTDKYREVYQNVISR